MKNNLLLPISFLILFTTTTIGQKNIENVNQPELDSGTIENQFDYLITKSSQYKDFQLIRKISLLKVKAHTLDSLEMIRKGLKTTNASLTKHQTTIKRLENEVTTLNTNLKTITQEKNSMALLGKNVDKSSYNTSVWVIIIVLVIALLFFIFQFKNNNVITKRTKNELNKIEEELSLFKKNAMKKEQELMRKLQDELNKNNLG